VLRACLPSSGSRAGRPSPTRGMTEAAAAPGPRGDGGRRRARPGLGLRRDAALSRAILGRGGLAADSVPDLDALCAELGGRGAALAVVAEEALATADPHRLTALARGAAALVGLPVRPADPRTGGLDRNPRRCARWSCWARLRSSSGPFHPLTLTSAARAALGARRASTRPGATCATWRSRREAQRGFRPGCARSTRRSRPGSPRPTLDGRFLDANEAFLPDRGLRARRAQGADYAAITHPDDLAADADAYRRLPDGRDRLLPSREALHPQGRHPGLDRPQHLAGARRRGPAPLRRGRGAGHHRAQGRGGAPGAPAGRAEPPGEEHAGRDPGDSRARPRRGGVHHGLRRRLPRPAGRARHRPRPADRHRLALGEPRRPSPPDPGAALRRRRRPASCST
jgi:hypothetical protein